MSKASGRRPLSALAYATLLILPLGAQAATVTYGFTGVVTSTVGGVYSGASIVGDKVTGSFSISTGNVDPSAPNSVGIVGSATSNWEGAEQTGSALGTTPSAAYVFSSSIYLNGGVAYSTASPGGYESSSYIEGAAGGTYFAAGENQTQAQTLTNELQASESGFSLSQSGPAFTADGLPLFAAGPSSNDSGYYGAELYACVNTACTWTPIAQVDFAITSLNEVTPVPLPAAAWLLLSGLGGLGALARKRK